MPRLPMVEREDLAPADQPIFDALTARRGGVLGPFRVLLHHPQLASRVGALSDQLRFSSVLNQADLELAILTAGREVESPFQWVNHEPFARQAGTRPEAIEVLRHQRPTNGLLPREVLIIDTIRALWHEHRLTDEHYARLAAEFSPEEMVEIITVAGYYNLLGFVINTFEVEMPAGTVPPFEVSNSPV